MTAPGTCVVRRARPDATPSDPTGSLAGLGRLADMVAAHVHWKGMTRHSRTVVARAYRKALLGAKPGDVVPLPAVHQGTHPHTVAALTRRGMLADGKLTPLAVQVVALMDPVRKPTITVGVIGGRL